MKTNPAKKNRKRKILEAALTIFAEKGVKDTTISEISKAAGVSDATVYEYFKSKEDLLFAIPEKKTTESLEFMEKIIPYIDDPVSQVRAIVREYLNLYQINPDYGALIVLHLKSYKKFSQTSAYKSVQKAANILLDCLKRGIDDGNFREDMDPYLIRSMILGTIENLCIKWYKQGSNTNLMDYVNPIMNCLLYGVCAESSKKEISIHLHFDDEKVLTQEANLKKNNGE
ncbi:MAG: TetR/AcrR family transcriptional regulator [Deltaproteobacteria bacterium]|nr:TetR/AcrR family transcriptional regulator [Deltaproteobacteria bacterium]